MTIPEATSFDDSVRFPSLESLRVSHTELLKEFRTDGNSPEMNAKIEDFIRRGRATGALLEADADRWAAQSQLDYWATKLYQPGYEPPDATLSEFDPQLAPELADELCPYVGLEAFRELNQSDFFGRAHLVRELVRKLETTHFLIVLGSSGSGKSSVVRAGLIPELKKGELPVSADWHYFPPMVPGSKPLVNLARLLMSPDADLAHTEIEADLYRQNNGYLAEVVSRQFNKNVVIVVDQFEEVFTLCTTDEVARQRFVDNLISLCQVAGREHRVIITMRTDFEAYLARLPELQAMLEQAVVRVTALGAGELREAIEAPAARIGLKFEEGVVDALLKDTLGEPAALPLLQFTLLKLWERRERNRVTWEAYKKLGGGRETLARSADDFYNRLIPEEQVTMRRILLKMVRFIEGLEVTSQRVRRVALYEKAEARDRIDRVLDRLIQARLVRVSEGDIAADEQVEVAHEALIRNWPRLGEWLEEERVALRQRQRLRLAAEEWQRLERDPSALWRGILLEEARLYDDLSSLEAEFLGASSEAEQTELNKLHERAAQLRRIALWLAAALVVALIAVVAALFYGVQSYQTANINSELAKTSRAGELASQSVILRDSNFQLSLLLGVEAYHHAETLQTRSTLLDNVQISPQLQAFLSGHPRDVDSVAYSPDGKALASAGCGELDLEGRCDQWEIILWDTETHQRLGQPLRHTGRIFSIAFSPDGQTLASVSSDQTILLWDVATHQPIGDPLIGNIEFIFTIAFSPDGSTLASGGSDALIELWNVPTHEPIGQPLIGHTDSTYSIAFNPDGETLASGSGDGTIMLWSVSTHEPIGQPLIGHTDSVTSIAFSPDGQILASGAGDQTIRLWDVATHRSIGQPLIGHTDSVTSIAFSPEGGTLASGSSDQTIILWSISTQEPKQSPGPLRGHGAGVSSIAFSPDGQILASGANDGTLILWHVRSYQPISKRLRDLRALGFAFSPDGRTLALGSPVGTIVLGNLETDERVQQVGERMVSSPEYSVSDVAFSPDGKMLAWCIGEGKFFLWDVERDRSLGQPISDLATSVHSLAFSPDGKILALGGQDGTILLWDMETGQAIGEPLDAHRRFVKSLDFSPDGKILASGGDDAKIILWDVSTALNTGMKTVQMIGQPLSGHKDNVESVTFSPDGKTLASGSRDRTIILWDVRTGQPIGEPLRGHRKFINTVAFSPDGKALASGGWDQIVILWDAETHRVISQPLNPLLRDHENVFQVAFSQDGRTLLSSTSDGRLYVWDLDPQSWIEKTCRRAGRNFTPEDWAYYFPNEEYRPTCSQESFIPVATPVSSPTP